MFLLELLANVSIFKLSLWIILVVVTLLFLVRVVLRAISSPYPQIAQHDNERYFIDPNSDGSRVKFPSILSVPSVDVTVIVPSYNEEARLPAMLDEAIEYFEKRRTSDKKFKYEIVIVDDGSRDATCKVGLEYSKKHTTDVVRVLKLEKNRGKGGAIRMGVLRSRGRLILFADADGATRFSDFEKLENSIKKNSKDIETNEIVVCGSRRHLEQNAVAQRSLFRTILMYGFHFLVWFLCVKGVRDTQCGFKLFTRPAALKLFSNLHIERWAFDVDLLYIATHFKMQINEIDVNWKEMDGSKVTVASWIQMGTDLLLIRLRYMFGAWKLNENLRLED